MTEEFDNPYDPASEDLENETRSLDIVIADAVDKKLYETHTWLPAVVTNVRGNQLVDIQPQLLRKYKDGKLVKIPVIQNVLVGMPRGKSYWIKLPVAVGDTGIALFCERSIDRWGVSGGFVDPQDSRKHHVSDAIFIPGIYPSNDQVVGAATDMVLHNGAAEIQLQPAGTFKMKNATNELLDLLTQTVQAIIDARVNTMLGPQQVINFEDFEDLLAKLNTLKG